MSELKPCPFCGEQPRIKKSIYLYDSHCPTFDIVCYECNRAETKEGFFKEEFAINFWNTRAKSDEDDEKDYKLSALCDMHLDMEIEK